MNRVCGRILTYFSWRLTFSDGLLIGTCHAAHCPPQPCAFIAAMIFDEADSHGGGLDVGEGTGSLA
jgi:hypothetical protein